jgi:8-oxo-dGTP diphosphatase
MGRRKYESIIQHIVIGIIHNSQAEILLARRPVHVHQGGLWEFPGGKIEIGETPETALARELKEEIGIIVQQAHPLINITHSYLDKKISLDVWNIEQWQGKILGKEGQKLQWCKREQLKNFQFPAANQPIITAIQLPSQYLITPEPNKQFFYQLEASLETGISLVQLRAKNLSELDYCHYAEKALTLCHNYNAQLLINATPKVALSIGTDGVHLNRKRLFNYQSNDTDLLVAASCHSLEEIQQANLIGLDFIVLSPVCITTSHPNASPLGWTQFAQLTKQANCPVFALGGMLAEDVSTARMHGGQGIAAIRALWGK